MRIPPPRNLKQLRRFLGICGYQTRFLISYAQTVQPLRTLTRKDVRWKWTETEQSAFEQTKQLFKDSVLIERPNYDLPFIIYSDASYKGLGAVLVQEDKDGQTRVIATASRSLSRQESNLFPTEIEICAIHHALQKFRCFVFDRKIIVRSDSISLSFIHRCKLTSSRISRFIHEIMAYNLSVEYIKGADNIFADLLSRLPRNQELARWTEPRENRECVIMRLGRENGFDMSKKIQGHRRNAEKRPSHSKD